jgi:hypothetical protein
MRDPKQQTITPKVLCAQCGLSVAEASAPLVYLVAPRSDRIRVPAAMIDVLCDLK